MKKLFKIIIVAIIIGCIFLIGTYDYGGFDKEVILDTNGEDILNNTESSILDLMQSGNNYLIAKDYENAKKSYEAAISKNILKESTYLEIKDKYINAKRFDDAYYIVKLAIDNNVSVDSMKNILEEIKSNFEITTISRTITENDKFSLPTEVSMKINDIDKTVNVRWEDNSKISTSIPGSYSYIGYADEYDRTVQLNLTINKKPDPIKATKIGIVKGYSEKNGYLYITFDEAEFYLGEEAKKKKMEDGITNEGELEVTTFYLRNISKETKEYKINKDVNIEMLDYVLSPEYKGNGTVSSNVSIDQFKQFIDKCLSESEKYNIEEDRMRLFWINTEDDIIVNMEMQYTP